uniref:Integrase, catalytic region, zinc finger, CCHC-type, peptidase aspartic, catalytic n=1 Tax=Tanacetum cinerariifolium TaxID=118510 RepID=A0A6L2L4M9_TANCI|nr:integrase, catalytic region, zinc finger, CCHC-type, peptidase aspartic, catalytic [Tanacetum cinerariifolium]
MGKSKKKPHKPKSEDTNQEKLYLLHMDLCGLIPVVSVSGKKYILVIVDDYSRSLEPALHEMTPSTISSGLVLNPPPSTPFVPPLRTDWDLLFQPLFDELLTPSPKHGNKWTKDHPLDNIIGELERPISTRLKLYKQALFCCYDAFLTSVEPKTYKDALTRSCRIEAMQDEINEFERLKVWELVPRPDKVMVITLKWIYKVKLDELGGILKNKAQLVARGYRQEEGIDLRNLLLIMDTTKAHQIALDDDLVAPANRLKIRKCNHRLSSTLKSNEPTLQVATVSIHHTSLYFKMNGKSHTLNIDNFLDILQICPRLPGQKFEDPPFEEEILSFIRYLGHNGEIKVLTDVNVNTMHQPCRSFAAIINSAILLDVLTNQEILESKAYKEYYVVASGAEPPKAKTKYKKKADEPVTPSKSISSPAAKGIRLKTLAKDGGASRGIEGSSHAYIKRPYHTRA